MAIKSQYQVAIVNESVTIAAGQTTSSILYSAGTSPAGLFIPSNWTAGTLTFQASSSPDGNFSNICDFDGTVLSISANPTVFLPLIPSIFNSVVCIRLVSSIAQASDVTVNFSLTPIFQGIHN